jgi:LacI family transcriptional regulator
VEHVERATTMRDVAERAGVSTATVSRVISGTTRVRPATRAGVMAAVEALRYRPSGVARSLKLRSTRTIGLVVTDIANPYFPKIVRAVEDAALERGHAVLLCDGADDPSREETYLDLLIERRVDGIVIASSGLEARYRDWLARRSVPVVLVNCTARGASLSAILSDNRAGGRLAAEHVLALGHRAIGHISAPSRNAAAGERLAGIGDAIGAVRGADLVVVDGDGGVDGAEEATSALLDRLPGVTAILCYNDLTAIGVVRALRERGLRVPADVSVVGYDDVPFCAWLDPALTTVAQDTSEMGRWAVERLVGLIGEPAGSSAGAEAEVVLLPVGLRVRESTAPPAAARA